VIRFELGAVSLLDYAANVQRRKNRDNALIVGNDNSTAARGKINMIHGSHRIIVPVGRADRKWDESPSLAALTEISNHTPILH
jgi:hypothetical protein